MLQNSYEMICLNRQMARDYDLWQKAAARARRADRHRYGRIARGAKTTRRWEVAQRYEDAFWRGVYATGQLLREDGGRMICAGERLVARYYRAGIIPRFDRLISGRHAPRRGGAK